MLRRYTLYLFAVAILCAPWLLPGSVTAVVTGWISVVLLVAFLYEEKPIGTIFCLATVSHAICFPWLVETIARIFTVSLPVAILIFILFITLGSLQLVGFVLLRNALPQALSILALRAPIAWTFFELLPIRIFPWQFSHTQLAFVSLVQIAEIFGSTCISFLMFWCIEAFWLFFKKERGKATILLPASALIATLIFGQ